MHNRSIATLCTTVAAVLLSVPPARADHPSATFGNQQSGPLITIPAATLPQGMWSAGLRVEYLKQDPLSDAVLEQAALSDEHIHSVDQVTTAFLGLGYGVTDRLTLGLTLPYISREAIRAGELEGGIPEAHSHGDAEGLGDMTLLAQYLFHRTMAMDMALLAGAQLPTGEDDVLHHGAPLDAEFQPGTGTWQPLLGIAVSRPLDGSSLDANLLYRFGREGTQDFRQGDLLNYNLAWSFLLGHEGAQHGQERDHTDWSMVLELNGEWRERNESVGVEEAHSGGNLVYFSPGMRAMMAGQFSVFASLSIPVVTDLNGTQSEPDYRINAGVGKAF